MSFLSVPISIFPTKQRQIDAIKVDVIINESANDTLTITKQPVQQGASITDHAYKEPTGFSATINFRDNSTKSLSKIYRELLDLQVSRVPFTIITPKRIYRNMLMSSIGQTTDAKTENCLALVISCQEVILVPVTTTQVPRTKQKSPGATGATQNAGKKSAILTGIQGFVPSLAGFTGGTP